MALKINYELRDGEIVEGAYVRITNVKITNKDFEQLEPDGENLIVNWITKPEGEAIVFVYPDEGCRRNQVQPFDWFVYNFDYSFELGTNPFEQCYNHLNVFKFKGLAENV